MRSTEARILVDLGEEEDRFLPEGPRSTWVFGPECLMWVNIQTGPDATRGSVGVRCWDDERMFSCVPMPGRPGFLAPVLWPAGIILVGCDKTLGLYGVKTGQWKVLTTIPDDHPRTIINDAEIVPGGKAVVFGTKDTQFKEPIANLYLYTVDDNQVSLLADKQTCSNGKVFATDARGLTLYDIDTPTQKVVRYQLDVGARTATPDGVALDLADQVGFPDGMCECGDGTVIIAFYNPAFAEAGKAIRYDLATGKVVEVWTTPGSPRVTCPLLVKRPDGVKLILTTATEGMPPEMRAKCPNAGCLFIADTQFVTCPEPQVVRLG